MHDAPYHVLATAWDAPETGGPGDDEPVMVVQHYGEGRVYHHVLGHVWPADEPDLAAIENANFRRITARAAEWAATGEVTLP